MSIAEPQRTGTKKSQKKKSSAKPVILENTQIESQEATTIKLKAPKNKKCPSVNIQYTPKHVEVTLNCGRDALLAGKWETRITIDGEPLLVAGPWEETLRFSDDDVGYFELELPYVGDISIQRQFVLLRKDKVVLLADAVIGKHSGRIEYISRLPLGDDIRSDCEEQSTSPKTTELKLVGSKPRAWVLPLALSEWASETRQGSLRVDNNHLEYCVVVQGSCLYAPLWFDLDRSRSDEDLTWRQLTVAEHRVILPRDTAAGYRVQIAKKNWLIYRALASKGNRTLLGHNLSTEFLLAKFTKKGNVSPLMVVE